LNKDAVCLQFCATFTANFLVRKLWKGFGDFKIAGQIIHTVKYVDDLLLLAKEGKVKQDMIDKLIEIGRCYGLEMNVGNPR